MQIDVKTLFVFGECVAAILGLLLLSTWYQNRENRALLWWGGCILFGGVALFLLSLRGQVADIWSIDLANALFALGFAMGWTGAREFERRPPNWPVFFAGAAIWLVACRIPAFYESMSARTVLMSAVLGTYTLLGAIEFWRGRAEYLASRWPAVALLGLHAGLFYLRIPLALAAPMAEGFGADRNVIFNLLHFEGILYAIAIAFIVLAMAKERSELVHRQAALVDVLTGVANRRAFFDAAARQLKQQSRDPRPITVLLFDLDRFKSVNDRCGHSVGDRVLKMFAEVSVQQLRSTDLFGRLGGEEFAALLIGADLERARLAAERIRVAFAAAADALDGVLVEATVSAGVAMADGGEEIRTLLDRADRALYAAKAAGRNRVETIATRREAESEASLKALAQTLRDASTDRGSSYDRAAGEEQPRASGQPRPLRSAS